MKKFMALVLMAITLVTVAANAMAVTPFEFRAYCNDTTRITYDEKLEHQEKKTSQYNNNKVYVKHWVTGGSDSYTNMFKARKFASGKVESGTNCGSKWATIGLNVPIQSNSITANMFYTMAGRGNTNHYDSDGVSSITLHGTFDPNL